MEIPAVHHVPIPTVSLPLPVNDGAWTFDDKGVPIRQYASTPYFAMEADGASTTESGDAEVSYPTIF
jgi:hypothetical protein